MLCLPTLTPGMSGRDRRDRPSRTIASVSQTFLVGHAAQHDGHEQRRGLVVGRWSPAVTPSTNEFDLLARQARRAIALFGDYVDDAHEERHFDNRAVLCPFEAMHADLSATLFIRRTREECETFYGPGRFAKERSSS